jgi:hypothetical protein
VTTTDGRQLSINFGALTDSQIAFLESVPWHLESHPGDDEKLRTVFPSIHQAGRWFSARWPTVAWDFIRPSVNSEKR